jgi:hypothetical protein
MKLVQKQGSRRNEFQLEGNTLHIKTKSMGETKEWSVDVEYIGEERFYKTNSRLGPRIIGIVFFLISIISVVGFFMEKNLSNGDNIGGLILGVVLFGGLGLLTFFAPMRNELYLVGGSAQVMFLLDSPSKEEMENFIREIIKRSRKVLLEKYGTIDVDLPEETQFNNFYWLKNRGLITNTEYDELKQEYRSRRLML